MPAINGNSNATADILLSVIRQLIEEGHPHSKALPVSLDSDLERDLGLDSLSMMELQLRLEKTFDIVFKTMDSAATPRDLLRDILRASSGGPGTAIEPGQVAHEGPGLRPSHHVETLVDVLLWHARKQPQRVHISLYNQHDEVEEITYRELDQQSSRFAAALRRQLVDHGQTVAIMLPTCRDYFYSFFGVLRAGAIPVPIYPPARITQIEEHLRRHARILDNAMVRILITVPEARAVSHLLKMQIKSLRLVIDPQHLLAANDETVTLANHPQDIALLQYTSGSTGNPKGVVLSHANLLANIRAMGRIIDVQDNDVFVSWLPLYHDMGLIGAWLGSLYYSIPLVLLSPQSFLLRPASWLWAIHRHRGTLTAAPNFAYELCLNKISAAQIEGLDLSSVRIAFNGAEPVSPRTIGRFHDRFVRYGFSAQAMTPVYGLAESSVGLTFPPVGRGPVVDTIDRRRFEERHEAVPLGGDAGNTLQIVSCGHPLPGHQVRIVDAAQHELPDRREGRLQFRGPSAASGYFRNPDATRQLFAGEWLDSGDLGYADNGEIFVTGRAKDIIIRAGHNIYPQELEAAVAGIPGIRKGGIAVFGVRDSSTNTEKIVILAETQALSPQASKTLPLSINRVCNDLVGQTADDIVLVPPHTVLKTSSGKVRRSACRAMYEHGHLKNPAHTLWWQLTHAGLLAIPSLLRRWAVQCREIAYALYVWIVAALLAMPVCLFIPAISSLRWRWIWASRAARLLAKLAGIRLLCRGAHNLPKSSAYIMVCNHASYIDSLVLIAALPIRFRFVAKAELLGNPVTRVLLTRLDCEFVDRFNQQQGARDAKRIGECARHYPPLLLFPEGTFSRTAGLLPFYNGAFAAAVEAGVPVIPVTLRGTRAILRADSWFPRRGILTVHISPAIPPAGSDWAAVQHLRDSVRSEILRHCGEPGLAIDDRPM